MPRSSRSHLRYAPSESVHGGSAIDAVRPQALFVKLYPVEYGALTQLWAGTMPEALEHNGEVSNIICSAMHASM